MPDSLPNPQERDLRIDYIEIPVTDMAEAKRFFGEAFGWSFTDYGPDYTAFTEGRLEGGLRDATAVTTGGPLVVFYAQDLDAAEAKIDAVGGRIGEHISFPGGRRFQFFDPSGNEFAVWSEK